MEKKVYISPQVNSLLVDCSSNILTLSGGSNATNGLDNAPEYEGDYTGGVSVGTKFSDDWDIWGDEY
ncbi:MAG: hypothetical protein IJQ59_08020 [Bacteroidaceae bacterium]|nr:hypothetical protein [Bacteroidaceae bacterium]